MFSFLDTPRNRVVLLWCGTGRSMIGLDWCNSARRLASYQAAGSIGVGSWMFSFLNTPRNKVVFLWCGTGRSMIHWSKLLWRHRRRRLLDWSAACPPIHLQGHSSIIRIESSLHQVCEFLCSQVGSFDTTNYGDDISITVKFSRCSTTYGLDARKLN